MYSLNRVFRLIANFLCSGVILCPLPGSFSANNTSHLQNRGPIDRLRVVSDQRANQLRSGPPNATADKRTRAEQLYAKLPLSFEENKGQVDPAVKFLSRAGPQTIFLTSTEAVFSLRRRHNQMLEKQDSEPIQPNEIRSLNPPEVNDTVFRMKMVGANSSPTLTGIGELPGKTNYLKGSNPDNWRKKVANYAKVKYQDVYPGIDMVYYGNQRHLEYDLIVKPGRNPNRIRFSFKSSGKARVDRSGDLVLRAKGAELRQHKPIAYQEVNGLRKSVSARYAIRTNGDVSFKLGKYRRDISMFIDPVLTFASYLGGSDKDLANAISVDSSGAVYLAGSTRSTDFPTAGSLKPAPGFFEFDAFVTKLDPTGSALVYSTYLGGSNFDSAAGIKVDSSGYAFVVGTTVSSEFPGTHTFQTNPGGSLDGFVLKLSPDGSSLIYSIGIGGSSSDQPSSLALDSTGNVYFTGSTASTDFPLVNELSGQSGDPNFNAFVVKLNQAGDSLLYSTYLGGTSTDQGNGIAVDGDGNAYVAGITRSLNFPLVNSLRQSAGGPCFKTTNSGIHWDSAGTGIANPGISSIAISATDPTILFAIDESRTAIYKSTNSGASWNVVEGPSNNVSFKAIAVDPTNPAIVYASNLSSMIKSTNGGATWFFSGVGLNSGSVLTIAIHPGRPSLLYAGVTPAGFEQTQFFKSTDSGATWAPSPRLIGPISSIAIGENTGNTVYAAGPRHVFKSTNGGDSWIQISALQSNITPLATDPSNSSVIYFGADTGVFKSTDGGSTFARTGFELTGRVDALVMDPQNPSILYAGGAFSGDVFKTTDAGASWVNASQGLTYGNVVALAIDPLAPSTLYLGGEAVTDAFVVKLSLPSAGLTYSTLLGGRHDDLGIGIAVDNAGNAYVTGTAFGNDFPATNAYQPTFAGGLDVFVTKLNASGSALTYSTFFGGNDVDEARAIAVDSTGNVYVTGFTQSPNFPTFNAVQDSHGGKRDAFAFKLSPAGLPVYSTYLGGSDDDSSLAIAFDANGAAYIAGTTASTNFPATVGSLQTSFAGGEQDAFVAKITPSALALDAYSKAFAANGGSGAVNVSGPPNAMWTAISNDSWITINDTGPGFGDGPYSYSVDSNLSPSPRSGTITVADLRFKVLQGVAFNDVPPGTLFYDEIGKLSARGITSGCGSGQFCPNAPVTREQMAAFVIRALGDPTPFPFFNQRFSDVPFSSPFAPFIEQMAARQITLGCGGDKYCPSNPVLRDQMSAFIIRALGEFNPPTPVSQRFNDVAPSNLFYNFIDRMAVLNITAGCSQSPPLYCPSESVTRAQMAAFLVRAFKL